MAYPIVSIIIPCYNAAPWICDAIQSALSQTYPSVEVIVVDDGSRDESRDIICKFSGRIKFEFIEHRGAGHARNKGIRMACGEFIQFLDADDILFPHCVDRKIKAFLSEEADVVYSGGFFFNVKANAGSYDPQTPPGQSRDSVVAHVIASTIVSTLLMSRKTCLEAVGAFDENMVNGQEHDLLLRLAVNGFKFTYVPEALSLNRTCHTPSSITSQTFRNPSLIEMLFCRFEEKLKNTNIWTTQVSTALAWRFYQVGVWYMAVGDKRSARMMFRRARELDRNYISRLPYARQWLVPLAGGYLTELVWEKVRRLFPP